MDLHGGTIEASSEGRGKGSVFTIRLPLAKASAKPISSGTARTAVTPVDGSQALRHRRILLVEDHEPTRHSLSQLLRNRQYEVVSAGTLSEALSHAGSQAFDMVLSDIGLPDGDGFVLMSLLQKRHGLRGVALTGYSNAEDVAKRADAGFSAHLMKPIDVSALDRALADFFEVPAV